MKYLTGGKTLIKIFFLKTSLMPNTTLTQSKWYQISIKALTLMFTNINTKCLPMSQLWQSS